MLRDESLRSLEQNPELYFAGIGNLWENLQVKSPDVLLAAVYDKAWLLIAKKNLISKLILC